MAKKGKGRRSGARPQPRKAQAQKRTSTPGQRGAKAGAPGPGRSTKAERIEAARRARRRKRLLVRAAVAAIAVLLVAGVVVRVLGDRKERDDTRRQLTAGSCTFDTRADPTDPAPGNHVPSPTFAVDPPAGGNHSQQAAGPGTYREGDVPPDGQLVHSLEHGYVIFWHRPDISQGDREAIQEVADRYDRDVLVVPRPSLRPPVAATAWGNRLLCRNVEPDALDLFTRSYRNKGPEKVPHE